MELKKVDWFLIISLLGLLILFFFFLITEFMGIHIGQFISLRFVAELVQTVTLPTALLIVFIVCIIGNLLPVPTPYSFIVLPVTVAWPYLWWLHALVAALGCLVGEMGGYLVGRGSREALKSRNFEKIEDMKLLAEKRPYLMMFFLYLAGATPLNDDMFTIPLGLAGFSMVKTVSSMFLGKLTMMSVIALLGMIGISIGGGTESSPLDWILMILIFAITVLIIWIMFKINYKRFLKDKYGIEELEE